MNNYEKYLKAFVDTFEIGSEEAVGLAYTEIDAWDSVGHMALIAALEEVFDIMMETDDIIDLSSFNKGREILSEHYNVEF